MTDPVIKRIPIIRSKYLFLSPYRIKSNKARPEFVHKPAKSEPKEILPVEYNSLKTTVAAQFGMNPMIHAKMG